MAKSPARSKAKSASRKAPAAKAAARPARGEAAGLGARPLWSGNLRLALVSVPVKVFPATRTGARISFHQVHKPSGKRIRYEKVVPGIGPVDTDDIVKGFELEKGKYVLFDPEEIEELKLETKKTLDLVQFVGESEIGPIWYDRPHYVVPDGELAEEAYGVLRDALRSTGRVGLGQLVMRGREYVGAVRPWGDGILLETLRFADEVRNATPFFAELGEVESDPELLRLAEELIQRKTKAFDPAAFKDQYTEAVRELIDARAKRRKPVEIRPEEPSGGAKVINLVDALKKSVSAAERGRRTPARRKAG